MTYDLSHFTEAHRADYDRALSEIKNGSKETHWMWYIFPQLVGLGHSYTAKKYGIADLDEARAFLSDEYLGSNLREISAALLQLQTNDPREVFGSIDSMKLRSSMTLFSAASPEEKVFFAVLDKFFDGKPDYQTLNILGIHTDEDKNNRKVESVCRYLNIQDDNIEALRSRYPNGLHFVVGDTHGEYTSLRNLMEKIKFNPQIDKVYFVGDYNSGGNSDKLLRYISQYYSEDYEKPGFHLIRGNHEREVFPIYELKNLPDIIVIRGRVMNYYLVHAGMVNKAFDLINADMDANPTERFFAYALSDNVACYDAPLRQITWSMHGLYSQKSRYHVWPSEESLHSRKACIIHGHTPFPLLIKGSFINYGDRMIFWENQKIWFAEDLQSFDIDSNIKGRYSQTDNYRGLSCICLEAIDELAEKSDCTLTREQICSAENFVFSVPYRQNDYEPIDYDIKRVLNATPKMKFITLGTNGEPEISDF